MRDNARKAHTAEECKPVGADPFGPTTWLPCSHQGPKQLVGVLFGFRGGSGAALDLLGLGGINDSTGVTGGDERVVL